MQIHELNNFTGTLGSGSYLAIDDGTDTGKISKTQLFAATEARIDNIIAGPAPSAEEIVDARLGDDGVTYPSLGDAIRDQFADVKSDFKYIIGEQDLLNGATFTSGYYISAGGVITSSAGFAYTSLIEVNPTNYTLNWIALSSANNLRLHGYDSNGDWVAQLGANTNGTPITFSGYGIKYVRISFHETNHRLVCLSETKTVVGKIARLKEDMQDSLFIAPVSFTKLTNTTYWTFGQEVVAKTGANAADSSACRTAYIEFNEPIGIALNNTNYVFCVWVYSSQSVGGAVYSPSEAYGNEKLIILPKASTSYFRIGVKRIDGQTLTTDYSDTTSDAYKILNSIYTYKITSDSLDLDDIPVNAKAVKDNTFIKRGTLPTDTDLNNITDAGYYLLSSLRTYTNSPITTGFLIVLKESVVTQIAIPYGANEFYNPKIYIRNGSNPITSEWKLIERPFNHNVACFGDSIMWGRDGNESGTVQVDWTIPVILSHYLKVSTTNYGVGSQGYIGLISAKAYDNIASKDLTKFDTMIMCYGVNDGYAPLGDWNSTDESTIMGQFNKIINYVFSQNQTIRLIVVAPFNGRNVGTFPKYWYGERSHPQGYVSRQVLSDTLKQACEYYNIPYIEQTNSPINGFTIQTLIGADGVHPSVDGYHQLGEWLSGEIRRLIG